PSLLGVTPSSPVGLDKFLSALLEGFLTGPVAFTSLYRVNALEAEAAAFQGLVAGFRQGDFGIRSESHRTRTAFEHEAVEPGLPVSIYLKPESSTVAIAAAFGQGFDFGYGQGHGKPTNQPTSQPTN